MAKTQAGTQNRNYPGLGPKPLSPNQPRPEPYLSPKKARNRLNHGEGRLRGRSFATPVLLCFVVRESSFVLMLFSGMGVNYMDVSHTEA